ncbi:MAG: alpha/beta hydrolase [Maricaulaceae bacterium]
MSEFVIVPSPLLGPPSWSPTADRLAAAGPEASVAQTSGSDGAVYPWAKCARRILETEPISPDAILVGHSASGVLIAELATLTPVRALIFVDANIPPASGAAVAGDEEFVRFVHSLADDDGALPLWTRWWGPDALRGLFPDAEAFAELESKLPRMNASWFESAIDLNPWSDVPAGYVQTSAMFAPQAEDARRRGWPVRQLDGTHLHPLLAPEETAEAVLSVAREIG